MKEFRGPDPKVKPRGPKKQTRVKDPKVTSRTVMRRRRCFCGGQLCDGQAATGHHVIGKGAPHFGDDVEANIIPASGSGTSGCHGLVENEDKQARRMLGEYLQRERPDTIAYIREKLGETAGDDWLRRRLLIDSPPPKAARRSNPTSGRR